MITLTHNGMTADIAWNEEIRMWQGTVRDSTVTFEAPHWTSIIPMFYRTVAVCVDCEG